MERCAEGDRQPPCAPLPLPPPPSPGCALSSVLHPKINDNAAQPGQGGGGASVCRSYGSSERGLSPPSLRHTALNSVEYCAPRRGKGGGGGGHSTRPDKATPAARPGRPPGPGGGGGVVAHIPRPRAHRRDPWAIARAADLRGLRQRSTWGRRAGGRRARRCDAPSGIGPEPLPK